MIQLYHRTDAKDEKKLDDTVQDEEINKVVPMTKSGKHVVSSSASSSSDTSVWSGRRKFAHAWWTRQRQTAHARQFNMFISFLLFVVLCCISVSICHILIKSNKKELRNEALQLAKETGEWFSDELDKALLPLFSMAQFASELDIFKELPAQIGPAYGEDSLPFMPPTSPDGTVSHRNVTGVCDDPALVERFDEIASTIKDHAKMDGVLVNIQLAPQGVVCLLYPLNNTEDFPPGVFMDNTGARGLDLLTDSNMRFIAEKSIVQEDVSIAGPLTLRQCQNCDPTVEKAFIARIPVSFDGYQIEVDGRKYNRWGFATVLINWKELVERSGMEERFAERKMHYQLTRTDQKYDAATDTYSEQVVVLAETPAYEAVAKDSIDTVTVALKTTNNLWEISVSYGSSHSGRAYGMAGRRWKNTVISICVIVSFCISWFIYSVLAQRETQNGRLAEALARAAQFDTEKNMTAYFAHELRNPLGAVDCALKSIPDNIPDDAKELISGMQLSVDFMSSIMNNMLDFRKIEDGKMTLLRQPMSLSEATREVRKMLLPSMKDGVQFKVVSTTGSKDWVLGDVHRMKQVFTNVATNAIKYTSSGSVSLHIGWEGDLVRFECIDTGPGIPKNVQSQLFQRYVQRGGAPGTGLGLALSKCIVEALNGTIHFESDPSVAPGTSCIVLVPMELCEEPEAESSAFKEHITPIEQEFSVLIIDDIKMNRTMLKRRLLKAVAPNCIVTEASTGEEALNLCRTETFDVIIVDHYMEQAGGVLVGTDVVFAMRRMGITSHIVGCSGNTLDERFFDAGADAMWKKPLPSNDHIICQFRDALMASRTPSETSSSTGESYLVNSSEARYADDVEMGNRHNHVKLSNTNEV